MHQIGIGRTCLCSGAALAAWLLVATPGSAEESSPASTRRLEEIEDLSESLANDLLDLSLAVRDRDFARIAGFFADPLVDSRLPATAGPERAEVKWIARHDWTSAASPAPEIPRAPFLEQLRSMLDHFDEIEDARFKVKESSFDEAARAIPDAEEPTAAPGSTGRARIAFYVIGRDRGRQREWARGSAQVRVRHSAEGRWQFTSFQTTRLESLVATQELFSEVSIPAGVSRSLPDYAGGFIWHGAAAGDLDRDGWIDLFVTAPDRNHVYLNRGDGHFREASEETGVALLASGVAPLLLDYDNDGDEDVFLSSIGLQVLLENRLVPDGTLSFWDISLEAGVAVPAIGFSATAADVNGDGRPDIHVSSYNYYGQVVPDSWFKARNGTPNLLFVSQPGGGYREEAQAWGLADGRWSYAAAFADVNGDGRPDLYLANDFGENAFYVHQGEGFANESRQRGVVDPGNGMGAAFGDYDNDGLLDLHVTNMSSTAGNRILSRLFPSSGRDDNVLIKLAAGNNLYRNQGDGTFRDVTTESGGFSGGWAWGGGFLDFDNDGWEDLYSPNGFISGKSMKDT